MRLSKRVQYAMISFLVLLNLSFRVYLLRIVDHLAIRNDGVYNTYLAKSIIEAGQAKWLVSPLSYFGLYPLSYPSGNAFFISGVSLSTGIPIESSVLMMSAALSVLSVLFMYLLSREIINNALCAFLASFAFSLSPLFIYYTTWDGTSRAILITFIPLFLFLTIKSLKMKNDEQMRKKTKLLFLVFLVLLVMLSMHRTAVIILPLVVILFGVEPISKVILFVVQLFSARRKKLLVYLAYAIFIGAAAFLFYFSLTSTDRFFVDARSWWLTR